jgi:hypothetical protein
MSLFSTILSKLGFGGASAAPASAAPPPAAPRSAAPAQPAAARPTTYGNAALSAAPQPQAPPAPPPPDAIPIVDVLGRLDGLAAASAQKLHWKASIVDLMKLLGLDSSLGARKELAAELGCPADKMADSAQMNVWLHKTVLQKLAANGGNIPKDLLT